MGCQILLLSVAVSWRSRCGNRMLVKNRKLLEFATYAMQIESCYWPMCSNYCLLLTIFAAVAVWSSVTVLCAWGGLHSDTAG